VPGLRQIVDARGRHDHDVRPLAALQPIGNRISRARDPIRRHDRERRSRRALERGISSRSAADIAPELMTVIPSAWTATAGQQDENRRRAETNVRSTKACACNLR
jgi:hypothetical protein